MNLVKIGTILLKSIYFLTKKYNNSITSFIKINSALQKDQGILIFTILFGHLTIEATKYLGSQT